MEAAADARSGSRSSSRDSGRVLAVLAAGRRRIVEVGTAIGYSTLWMAIAQPADGTIVTIDPDRPRTDRARGFWRGAGLPDERITVVNAPALEAFAGAEPALAGPVRPRLHRRAEARVPGLPRRALDRLAPGALVVADNVLWSGRTSARGRREPATDARRCASSAPASRGSAFEATILPVGDGLLVATLRP